MEHPQQAATIESLPVAFEMVKAMRAHWLSGEEPAVIGIFGQAPSEFKHWEWRQP
jgi:hypothetical protein